MTQDAAHIAALVSRQLTLHERQVVWGWMYPFLRNKG
jgi:hypothetical protein